MGGDAIEGAEDFIKPHTCQTCQRSFHTLIALNYHNSREHLKLEATYICSICDTVISGFTEYQSHRKRHELPFRRHHPLIKCPFCIDYCWGKGKYEEHCKENHAEVIAMPGDAPGTAKCLLCPRLFASEALMQHHRIIEHQLRHLTCNICNERVFPLKLFKRHFVELHGFHDRFHTCAVCKKGFKWREYLERHEVTHEGGGSNVCQYCGKTFVYPSSMVKHEAVFHSEERPFRCAVCGKGYVCRVRYNRHMHTHAEPKYICEVCGRKFFRKELLDSHGLVHVDERAYKCGCGDAFKSKKSLQRHYKRVNKCGFQLDC